MTCRRDVYVAAYWNNGCYNLNIKVVTQWPLQDFRRVDERTVLLDPRPTGDIMELECPNKIPKIFSNIIKSF